MENKEKKKLLNSYRHLVRQEEILRDALEYNRQSYLAGSPKYDGMPHGGAKRDLSDYVVKAEKLLDELQSVMTRKHETLTAIVRAIEAMQVDAERTVLMTRYIKGLSLADTAREMRRTYRHITRLHGSALTHFDPEGGKRK